MMTTMKKMMKKIASAASAVILSVSAIGYVPAHAEEELTADKAASLINEVAILVNKARKEAGLKPLYVLPYLNEVAEMRAEESSVEFKHTRSDGSGFETVIDTDIVPYAYVAENLAGGRGTAEETFEQWRNSPHHWASIMNPNATHMGIGVYYDADSEYEWYWQQTFVMTDEDFADQYLPSKKAIVPTAIGDVDGDGAVTAFDYTLISDYARKKKEGYPVYFNEAQLEAADCFKDGVITEADAKVAARFVLGEYKSLPFIF